MINVLRDYPRTTPPEEENVLQVIYVTVMFDGYIAVKSVCVDYEFRGISAFDACFVALEEELGSDGRLSIEAKNKNGHVHEFIDVHGEGIDWLKRHIVSMQIVHYEREDNWPYSLGRMASIKRRVDEFL